LASTIRTNVLVSSFNILLL